MKNRKLVIVAFMLVAAMVMGIGYAAISGTLTITGTASAFTPNQESVQTAVHFTGTTGNNNDDDVTATATAGSQAATMEITFNLDEAVDDSDTVEMKAGNTITKTATYEIEYTVSGATASTVLPNAVVTPSVTNDKTELAISWSVEGASNVTTTSFEMPITAKVTVTVTAVLTLTEDMLNSTVTDYSFTISMPYVDATSN
ncbi:MAG: hypothetical protein IJW00_09010 [Clostridia bacterium]|nr:hypothetical protein [Clostridia bacterium]